MPRVTEQPRIELTQADQDRRRRIFHVEAASGDEALSVLRTERGIQQGSSYADPHGVIDTGVQAERFNVVPMSVAALGATRLYEIEVDYSAFDGGVRDPKTTSSAAAYIWGRSEQTIDLQKDLDDKAVENSRGELYDPAPQIVVAHRTLLIKWVVSDYSLSNLLAYDSVCNQGTWQIAGRWSVGEGVALSHGIDPVPKNSALTELQWSIEFKPGGKVWEPLKLVDYTIVNGQRMLLDGSGNIVATPWATAVVNEFHAYELKDFSVWGV